MLSMLAALGALGAEGSRRWGIGPCPACGQATGRGSGDRRYPIHWGGAAGAEGWECSGCGEKGDPLQLVSWFVARGPLRDVGAEGRREVRAFLASHSLCDPAPEGGAWRPAQRRPLPPPPPPEPERGQPPAAEVQALWLASRPVDEDGEVSAWLRGRGLDPHAVAVLDLARALPEGVACPRWAVCGGRAWSRTHRLLLRAVGPEGHTLSLRARSVVGEVRPKVAAAGGSPAGNMVYADRAARQLLAHQRPGRLVVVEGDPDWLTWASRPAHGWGVVGIWSGAWSQAIADAIPDGSEVLLRLHDDEAGQGYEERILDTLSRRRVRLLRRVR
jgi:hypothetical protein